MALNKVRAVGSLHSMIVELRDPASLYKLSSRTAPRSRLSNSCRF